MMQSSVHPIFPPGYFTFHTRRLACRHRTAAYTVEVTLLRHFCGYYGEVAISVSRPQGAISPADTAGAFVLRCVDRKRAASTDIGSGVAATCFSTRRSSCIPLHGETTLTDPRRLTSARTPNSFRIQQACAVLSPWPLRCTSSDPEELLALALQRLVLLKPRLRSRCRRTVLRARHGAAARMATSVLHRGTDGHEIKAPGPLSVVLPQMATGGLHRRFYRPGSLASRSSAGPPFSAADAALRRSGRICPGAAATFAAPQRREHLARRTCPAATLTVPGSRNMADADDVLAGADRLRRLECPACSTFEAHRIANVFASSPPTSRASGCSPGRPVDTGRPPPATVEPKGWPTCRPTGLPERHRARAGQGRRAGPTGYPE